MEETFVDIALGSGIPYVTFAVPFFFLMIGVEYWVGKRQGKQIYRLNDALSNLSCGIVQQMVEVFTVGFTLFTYIYVYDHFRLIEIQSLSSEQKWIAAIFMFLGVDLLYYWFHRLSHGINFLWAAHMVHHQSEEYNLAVALRQSSFQGWFSWAFFVPMALFFPPVWFISVMGINLIYQFWIHTRTIDKMGAFGLIFNTPSHHRVHHGKNPRYIDKNHAGMLIIWDKMFGTFEPEGEEVVYGTTRELKSWNPLWANLFEWKALYVDGKEFSKVSDRIKVFFAPPGWRPPEMEPEAAHFEMTPQNQNKYNKGTTKRIGLYALFQFVLMVGVGTSVLVGVESLGYLALFPFVLWVFWTSVSISMMIEERKMAWKTEPFRLLMLFMMVGVVLSGVSL